MSEEAKTVEKILDILKKCSPYPLSIHYLSIFTGESQPRLQGYLKFLMDQGLVSREQLPTITPKGIVYMYGYRITDKGFDYTIKKSVEKLGEEVAKTYGQS